MAEVTGDVLVSRVGAVADDGGLVGIAVAQLCGPLGPGRIFERRLAPRRALVGPVVQVLPDRPLRHVGDDLRKRRVNRDRERLGLHRVAQCVPDLVGLEGADAYHILAIAEQPRRGGQRDHVSSRIVGERVIAAGALDQRQGISGHFEHGGNHCGVVHVIHHVGKLDLEHGLCRCDVNRIGGRVHVGRPVVKRRSHAGGGREGEVETLVEVEAYRVLAVGVCLVLVERGRVRLDVNTIEVREELEQLHPAVAAVGPGLVVGHDLDDFQPGVVVGDRAAFAREVAAHHQEHLRIDPDQFLEDLLAGMPVGRALLGRSSAAGREVAVR